MRLYNAGGDGTEEASNRVLTVPNLLSFARLAILPLLYVDLVAGRYGRALIVGFIFGVTDWVDGYVARRFDQITKLGQLLDPVSDRLFIGTIGIGVVVSGLVPVLPVVLILTRDVGFLAMGLWMLRRGTPPPSVTRLGKSATFGLMWTFVPLLGSGIMGDLEDPQRGLWLVGMVMLWSSVVLYYAVAAQYAWQVFGPTGSSAESESPVG